MDTEREEVYERIPWETLERKGGDRQWLAYVVAGAVVLGALAYSFTRNQPMSPPPPDSVTGVAPTSSSPSSSPVEPTVTAPQGTVSGPVVVAEADLYAVDPERLIDQVAAHAEWVAVEYVSMDGSEVSRQTLASLLPAGSPLPEAPASTQVFVDWATATEVTEIGPASFDVVVTVRSLVTSVDAGFTRQPPRLVTVPIVIGEDGLPRAAGIPTVEAAATAEPGVELALQPVPDDVAATAAAMGEVLGGRQGADGSWEVVVMAEGPDGVRRPVTVRP